MINGVGRYFMKIYLFVGLFVFITAAHGENTPEVSATSAAPGVETKKETVSPVAATLPKDFLGLADLRATVNSDIANLEKQIKELQESVIPRAKFTQQKLTDLKQDIADLEQKKPTDLKDLEQLSNLKSELRFRSIEGGPGPELLSKELVDTKVLIEQKRQLAAKIQSAIASMLSPEQEFKRTMSMTFAALIACVIIGFFAVSFRDDKIRQAIFSGEAGIQFLTLFSLVIAIILFGITQILEGKELAALLGGLSGYILGRSTPKAAAP